VADKRGFRRYAIEGRVTFKPEGDVTKTIKSQVADISTLGWSAFIEENIDLRTIIQFDLTSYSLDQHLIGKGEITNVTQQKTTTGNVFRIGVKFIEADKATVLLFINEDQRRKKTQQFKSTNVDFF
jgi:hypothetical protein